MASEKKQGGRPVDAAAGQALKLAALQLVREKGYAKVSIAAIASAAGVARQTLYNRWNTKADLVLDAVFEETGRFSTQPPDDAGMPCARQLESFLAEVFSHLTVDSDPLRALIAAAQEDPAFQAAFRDRFVLPRERIVTELLRRAQARGELSAERDPEMLSAFVHGAFWYRLLNGQPVDAALARAIAAEVFAG
ncbi:TetR/AcrR family transcriptional regulator [Alloyangia pacifica]|uniref:TetR/AcrR family transcriptional regulator n=1 Tax=Alloyangia pacifica TaxID=311180 RepID=UPI001CFD4E68|nr:TetR-like C-terminal domain-containing protein [Alloyangia pacifica]